MNLLSVTAPANHWTTPPYRWPRFNRKLVWLAAAVAAAGLGATLALLEDGAVTPPSSQAHRAHPPPLPPINRVKPLTAKQAEIVNAAVPASTKPLETALPFAATSDVAGELSRSTALDCLSAAINYEAASESEQGQRAVAQVILNRVRHPAFPGSVCEVVYQGSERRTGCQFSFTCDGSLARKPSRRGWDLATAVAASALAGQVEPSVGMATHYHATWVVPYWASSLTKLTTIGAHIFYRWQGSWGRRGAFVQRYSGVEPVATLPTSSAAALGTDSATLAPIARGGLPEPPLAADQISGELRAGASLAADSLGLAADQLGSVLIANDRGGVLRADESGQAGVVP